MSFETLLTAQYISEMEQKGWWKNNTIIGYLNKMAAEYPERETAYDGRGRLTFEQLRKNVRRFAGGLKELGVQKGDVVSIQLPNWNEFIIAHFAINLIGAISNPLVPIYRENELSFMMGLSESVVYVGPKNFRKYDYETMLENLRPKLPTLRRSIFIGDCELENSINYQEWMSNPWEEKYAGELEHVELNANDLSEIVFTSGTTGEPKGVLHTHNTLIRPVSALQDRIKLTDQDVIHMASTFGHQTGFLFGVLMPTQAGAKGVYQDIWNPERFVELIEQERVTITFGATPFLHDLLKAKNLTKHDVSSLRAFLCIGAPIPRQLMREAIEILPNCKVLGGWGQTEDANVTIGKLDDNLDLITSTDGYPLEGMELRIVDNNGEAVEAGKEGSLEVRGPALFVGYAKRLEQTKEQFRGEWFKTGDLGIINDQGYLTITGRTKDIIVRGGENIPVAYVENVLHEHPLIDKAAVVPMPCPRLQERAGAFVVLKEGSMLTLEELKTFLLQKGLSKQYWPERLEVVDEFPRTPSGKIQKYKLREIISNILKEENESAG